MKKIDVLDKIIKKECKNGKDYQDFFIFLNKNNENYDYFVDASIFDKNKYENYKEELKNKMEMNNLTKIEKSCIGSILGMSIGDAMGARVEFLPLDYSYNKVKNMGKNKAGKFDLEPGQWTDDTSMGLCLADSLIEKDGEFDPKDIMMRFILWWSHGYNNAFRFDKKRKNKHSVGLGGNISGSLKEYIKTKGKNRYTKYGNKNTSGNGSIMRNAAIPICYFRNMDKALKYSRKQSLITHQGKEAAGCCQLLTFIIVKIFLLKIKELDKDNQIQKNQLDNTNNSDQIISGSLKDDILNNLDEFNCKYCESVNILAQSKQEGKDKNKNWNWKDKNFKYNEKRAKSNPYYIGSYCMDALSMALHVLYTTDSFEKALLKVVNLCGDADSVGSVVGQIAGAYYGLDNIPKDWIEKINKWDNNEIALRGYILLCLSKDIKMQSNKNDEMSEESEEENNNNCNIF